MNTSTPPILEKSAKDIYGKIWKMLIDARTKGKYDFKKGFVTGLKERKKKLAAKYAE